MANGTVMNLTGNGTGAPTADWAAGLAKGIWDAGWGFITSMVDIFKANPVLGIIILFIFIMLIVFVMSWLQEGGARFMKVSVVILIILVLLAILWVLQGQGIVDLSQLASSNLKNAVGVENGTNASQALPAGKTNFWT
jgi:hypothetical protein